MARCEACEGYGTVLGENENDLFTCDDCEGGEVEDVADGASPTTELGGLIALHVGGIL